MSFWFDMVRVDFGPPFFCAALAPTLLGIRAVEGGKKLNPHWYYMRFEFYSGDPVTMGNQNTSRNIWQIHLFFLYLLCKPINQKTWTDKIITKVN